MIHSSEIHPIYDYVAVSRLPAETMTVGGLYLPENRYNSVGLKCKVLAVGPGAVSKEGVRIPMEIEVGNTVVIRQWSGVKVKTLDEKEVLLVKHEVLEGIYESN